MQTEGSQFSPPYIYSGLYEQEEKRRVAGELAVPPIEEWYSELDVRELTFAVETGNERPKLWGRDWLMKILGNKGN